LELVEIHIAVYTFGQANLQNVNIRSKGYLGKAGTECR